MQLIFYIKCGLIVSKNKKKIKPEFGKFFIDGDTKTTKYQAPMIYTSYVIGI